MAATRFTAEYYVEAQGGTIRESTHNVPAADYCALSHHFQTRRGRNGPGVSRDGHQAESRVAIKVLPDAFGDDPDRLARFTSEAQLLVDERG